MSRRFARLHLPGVRSVRQNCVQRLIKRKRYCTDRPVEIWCDYGGPEGECIWCALPVLSVITCTLVKLLSTNRSTSVLVPLRKKIAVRVQYNCSGGKSTQLQYLSKMYIKDTLIESDSSKSKSQPVKFDLSKSLKVFGLKYT